MLAGSIDMRKQRFDWPEPQEPGVQEEPWFAGGLRFRCTGCGKCCTGSSRSVQLSREDVGRLAASLRMPAGRFVRTYTRLSKGRRVLTNAPGGGDCVFLKHNACSVYEARPTQCRTYPWWQANLRDAESWREAASFCEGIEHPAASFVPADEILEQLRLDEENEADKQTNKRANKGKRPMAKGK